MFLEMLHYMYLILRRLSRSAAVAAGIPGNLLGLGTVLEPCFRNLFCTRNVQDKFEWNPYTVLFSVCCLLPHTTYNTIYLQIWIPSSHFNTNFINRILPCLHYKSSTFSTLFTGWRDGAPAFELPHLGPPQEDRLPRAGPQGGVHRQGLHRLERSYGGKEDGGSAGHRVRGGRSGVDTYRYSTT